MKKNMKITVSLLLAFVLLAGTIVCGRDISLKASAIKQLDVTQEEAVQWVLDNYTTVSDAYSPTGQYYGECVSLVKKYIHTGLKTEDTFTIPSINYSYGIASDLDKTDYIKENYEIIYSGDPKPGDIFVWSSNYDPYPIQNVNTRWSYETGHTGIITEVTGSSYTAVNWNGWDGNMLGEHHSRYHGAGGTYAGKITAGLHDFSYLIRPAFKSIPESSDSQYTALVLDTSGSMSGTPIAKQKEAAIGFCETLINESNSNLISIVLLDNPSVIKCDFTNDLAQLKSIINATSIENTGGTNTNDALIKAGSQLNKITDQNAKKIIVLCSDGMPEHGETKETGRYTASDHRLYSHANLVYDTAVELKKTSDIYTLGFFHSLEGEDLAFAQRFMKDLQNKGYYNVNDPEQLKDVFMEIADNINDPPSTAEEMLAKVLEILKRTFSIMLALLAAALKALNAAIA